MIRNQCFSDSRGLVDRGPLFYARAQPQRLSLSVTAAASDGGLSGTVTVALSVSLRIPLEATESAT